MTPDSAGQRIGDKLRAPKATVSFIARLGSRSCWPASFAVLSTCSVALCELGCLGSERGKTGVEDGIQHIGIFDAGSTDDLAELQATQAGRHHVVGRHPRHGTEVEPLALVEFVSEDVIPEA